MFTRSEITLTDMRRDSYYIIFYVCWFWAVITGILEIGIQIIFILLSLQGLIPFLILAVLSFKIHRSMKKLKERLSQSQSNKSG